MLEILVKGIMQNIITNYKLFPFYVVEDFCETRGKIIHISILLNRQITIFVLNSLYVVIRAHYRLLGAYTISPLAVKKYELFYVKTTAPKQRPLKQLI